MNEFEWLACFDPQPMLDFLCRRRKPARISERRLTLFAAACCRRIWQFIPTEPCRRAIEVAERSADGLATTKERCTAWSAAVSSAAEEGIRLGDSYDEELIDWGSVPGGFAARAPVRLVGEGEFTASNVASDAAYELAWDAYRLRSGRDASMVAFEATYAAELMAQCAILRDIAGNPFHPFTIDPTWITPTVLALAQAAYAQRHLPSGTLDNNRLGVLADCLEDVGSNAALLHHFRADGPHVRGCFALDALIGKS